MFSKRRPPGVSGGDPMIVVWKCSRRSSSGTPALKVQSEELSRLESRLMTSGGTEDRRR